MVKRCGRMKEFQKKSDLGSNGWKKDTQDSTKPDWVAASDVESGG